MAEEELLEWAVVSACVMLEEMESLFEEGIFYVEFLCSLWLPCVGVDPLRDIK